jgi:ABC-type spermidine/putrescine transport system permease subunit I
VIAQRYPARRQGRWRHLLIAPTAIWTILFSLVPIALLVVYSFARVDLVTFDIDFVWSFESYRRIWSDVYLRTLVRSVGISVAATVICLVIGYPVALTIARRRGRAQTMLLIGIMVPFWTSLVVRTYGLVDLLADSGPIADGLRAVGLLDGRLDVLYSPWGVAIGVVYDYLPLMVLPIYVTLERIDPILLVAASDLGANRRRALWRVTVPLSKPGIAAGCILVGIPALGEYVIPAILGGDKTLMYGNVLSDQFLVVGDTPFGSALAISLMVMVGAVAIVTRLGTRSSVSGGIAGARSAATT